MYVRLHRKKNLRSKKRNATVTKSWASSTTMNGTSNADKSGKNLTGKRGG